VAAVAGSSVFGLAVFVVSVSAPLAFVAEAVGAVGLRGSVSERFECVFSEGLLFGFCQDSFAEQVLAACCYGSLMGWADGLGLLHGFFTSEESLSSLLGGIKNSFWPLVRRAGCLGSSVFRWW
jgi:hypothetical protein